MILFLSLLKLFETASSSTYPNYGLSSGQESIKDLIEINVNVIRGYMLQVHFFDDEKTREFVEKCCKIALKLADKQNLEFDLLNLVHNIKIYIEDHIYNPKYRFDEKWSQKQLRDIECMMRRIINGLGLSYEEEMAKV